MTERTDAVTFSADHDILLGITLGRVVAEARAHVAEAIRLLDPAIVNDPSTPWYWLARDPDRMDVNVEYGEYWVTDYDCDGADTYRERTARVTVWAAEGVAEQVRALWELGADAPIWVDGM